MANTKEAIWDLYAALIPNDVSRGLIPMADNDPARAAYGFSVYGMTPVATATDVLTLGGSSTKTIRIRQIVISGVATGAGNIPIVIHRRTTANSGGTSTTPTPGQRDGNDDAATAVVRQYSANAASLGTSIAAIDGGRLGVAATGNASIDRFVAQYGWLNEKSPVLRSATDFLAINLNGATLPSGLVLDIGIWWTEE
jgi:hypothetical protein